MPCTALFKREREREKKMAFKPRTPKKHNQISSTTHATTNRAPMDIWISKYQHISFYALIFTLTPIVGLIANVVCFPLFTIR